MESWLSNIQTPHTLTNRVRISGAASETFVPPPFKQLPYYILGYAYPLYTTTSFARSEPNLEMLKAATY